MGFGEIADMDVVADAGSIFSGVIASVDIGAITARFRAGKDQMIVALREAAANLSRRIGQI